MIAEEAVDVVGAADTVEAVEAGIRILAIVEVGVAAVENLEEATENLEEATENLEEATENSEEATEISEVGEVVALGNREGT